MFTPNDNQGPFRELPSAQELYREAEEQLRRPSTMALPAVQGHEAAVIQGTVPPDPRVLLRAQRDFIKAQVAFQHKHDIVVLIDSQKVFAEELERAIRTTDYRKLAGIQETYINMMTAALEELGVI